MSSKREITYITLNHLSDDITDIITDMPNPIQQHIWDTTEKPKKLHSSLASICTLVIAELISRGKLMLRKENK